MTIHNHITLVGTIDRIDPQADSDLLRLRVNHTKPGADGKPVHGCHVFTCLLQGRVREIAALLTDGDLVSIGATLDQQWIRDEHGFARLHTIPVVDEIHVLDVRVTV